VIATNRYYDKYHERDAIKLLPGEYALARGGEVLVTVLGSCVSACIRDERLRIGGMNHFMLPLSGGSSDTFDASGRVFSRAAFYGIHAMELLINALLKEGSRRADLRVKVFGGASVIDMPTFNVGEENGVFVRQFLRDEGLPVLAEDLFGQYARKVYFFPDSGAVKVNYLRSLKNDTVIRREAYYATVLSDISIAKPEIFS